MGQQRECWAWARSRWLEDPVQPARPLQALVCPGMGTVTHTERGGCGDGVCEAPGPAPRHGVVGHRCVSLFFFKLINLIKKEHCIEI